MAIQDVVLRYKAKKNEEFGDPIPRRLRWIEEAEKLYGRVTSWFGDPESEDNPVRFHEETVMLEDGWLGDYEMKCLEIEIIDTWIVLEPVGGDIFGADGRVDLHRLGDKSRGLILLLHYGEQGEARWEALRQHDKENLGPFDEACFERFLADALGIEPTD